MTDQSPRRRLERSPELMGRDDSALLVVDVQERLLAAQREASRIVWNCRRLADAAEALGVPKMATEQAPEKLGPTHPDLATRVGAVHSKVEFSAAGCGAVLSALRDANATHVVLAGIETHVCVAQTALDLLSEGFRPKVAVDAVGSRYATDHDVALRRLEASGVLLTTIEAVIFEWCESAGDAAFRQISELAKETAPAK